jgi:hypothetical protein
MINHEDEARPSSGNAIQEKMIEMKRASIVLVIGITALAAPFASLAQFGAFDAGAMARPKPLSHPNHRAA